MKINFFVDVKNFRISRKTKHIEWLTGISEKLNLDREGDINFIFVGRNTILKINKEFLKHNYITDVISFKYGYDAGTFGEIYICPFQVQKNAKIYKVTFENELRRVMAHGMLHLAGFNDGTMEEMKIMRNLEDEMLKLW